MTGKKIRDLRLEAEMTQGELAARLGVSPSAVGMYEQGRRVPDRETLLKLCALFRTTADFLLFDEDQRREGAPVRWEDFLRGLRGEFDAMRGRLLYGDSQNARVLTDAEMTRLWEAVRVAGEVTLRGGERRP